MSRTAHEVNPVYSRILRLYTKLKNPYKLYYGITREAADLANAERCTLMLMDNDRHILRMSAVTGVDRYLIEDVKIRAGEGIAGKVYEKGLPILIDGEERFREYAMRPRAGYKTPSSLSLPVGFAKEVIGVLNLSDKRSGEPFTENDVAILSAFAFQIFFILKLSLCYREAEQMRELSTTDFLTGLFNRRYFDIRLAEEYQRVRRDGGWFSLAMVDIDDFKLFNDTEGHLAGDEILKKIASVMDQTIRANDILARFGGEEFVIIMPQTSEGTAFKVAERIRKEIRNLTRGRWEQFPRKQITVCIGISAYNDPNEAVENVIKRADLALCRAKLHGKNCTVLYSDHFATFRREIEERKEIPGGKAGPTKGARDGTDAVFYGNIRVNKTGKQSGTI